MTRSFSVASSESLDPQREVRLHGAFLGGPILRVTADSFAVQTEKPPRVGESYPCELHLGDRILNIRGHVDWCLLKRMDRQVSGDTVAIYYAGISVAPAYLEMYRRAVTADSNGNGKPAS